MQSSTPGGKTGGNEKWQSVRELAAVIRGLRREKGWSHATLAREAGVGREWIIHLKRPDRLSNSDLSWAHSGRRVFACGLSHNQPSVIR